jgi:hypothetical protein
MTKISSELKANYEVFSEALPKRLVANCNLFRNKAALIESYARIASINALKIDLIEQYFPKGAAHFFYEAHNDVLLSHVNASFGSWRLALQSLRSFMENTLATIYFLDHPIEFEKWKNGKFSISPKELREYVSDHPKIVDLSKELKFKAAIDKEYGTLSKAVHGSSVSFRMTTEDGKTNIANPNEADLGKWSTRERITIDICLTAMIGVLRDQLEGAKMQNLRGSLGLTIKPRSRDALKKHCGVSIPAV